jgi:DnaJ-class molecular chaperone
VIGILSDPEKRTLYNRYEEKNEKKFFLYNKNIYLGTVKMIVLWAMVVLE